MLNKIWQWVSLKYIKFYANHSFVKKEAGLKVILTNKMRHQLKEGACLTTERIMTDALDRYFLKYKALVAPDVEVWIENAPEYLGIEIGIVTDFLGVDNWVRFLPMPLFMLRERIIALDKWWPKQKQLLHTEMIKVTGNT